MINKMKVNVDYNYQKLVTFAKVYIYSCRSTVSTKICMNFAKNLMQ